MYTTLGRLARATAASTPRARCLSLLYGLAAVPPSRVRQLPRLPHVGPPRRAPLLALAASAPPPAASVLSSDPAADASLPYRVLAFYAIAAVAEPDAAVERHRAFLASRAMVGRVYVCADGVNAQVSGEAAACAAYRAFCEAELAGAAGAPLLFKEDPIDALAFPRLRVKHKGLVPAGEGGAVDLGARGDDLSPAEWSAMLADGDGSKVVLDVRNSYEWDVGRFDGAARPALDHFADFDASSYGLPTEPAAKKATPVMMYCTGGIRCEYFSAKLKAEGFENVYKLQGGVQHYGNTMAAADGAAADGAAADGAAADGAAPHWKGSLFVFDRRSTVRFGGEAGAAAPPIGACKHCGGLTESFVNCCNIDCNSLHLVCAGCLQARRGFCTDACEGAPRRRALELLAATEAGDVDWTKVLASTQGAPPGEADPNRLATSKPDNVRRKEFDADKHGSRGAPRADAA